MNCIISAPKIASLCFWIGLLTERFLGRGQREENEKKSKKKIQNGVF